MNNMIRYSVSIMAVVIASPSLAGTFVFGDSSVEQGNLYARPGFDRSGSPYYAPDGFSRESNGPVWIEHLAKGMAPSVSAPIGSRNVNFAYSGATSSDDNIAGPVTGTGLNAQIDDFAARGLRGEKDDLFVVAIGTNDFIRDLGTRDMRETSAEVISNIEAGLDRLAGFGAGRVLVEDVPNLHRAPAFDGLVPPEDEAEFDKIMSGALDQHRSDQIAALRAQNARLSGTDIVTVKVSRLFDHVLQNAKALGFSNVTDACYDEAAGTLCSNDRDIQNSYLFFDGLHLTEAGQKIQADYYRALLEQLDGSAHSLPQSMAEFGFQINDQLAGAARDERFSTWASRDTQAGFSASAKGGVDADGTLAALGLTWSDGTDWTVHVDGARHDSDIGISAGSSEFKGWSLVLSGERRFDNFRFGASVGTLTGEADGTRSMPVALMKADHQTDIDGRFAEVAAGYVLEQGAFTMLPSVWFRWTEAKVGSFSENGTTGLEMGFDEFHTSGLIGGVGLNLRYKATNRITPWMSASYENAVTGFDGKIRGRLIDNSADDITRTVSLGRNNAELRAGVDLDLGV